VILLALDTALEACSVAILDGERVLAARSEPMPRGHQERLAPLVAELLLEAGVKAKDLDRVGVTVGPGSFTGLRVGLAFAKGLGAALDRPVVGIGALEALAASVSGPGVTVAVIDARREQIYLQAFEAGVAVTPPQALSLLDATEVLRPLNPARLVGSGAPLLTAAFPAAEPYERAGADPVALARLAAVAPVAPPRPMYLRAPDAKLPAGAAAA
jgi:tRNA threonylcarbamoyladenosine biosynthesis protein TsaB